MIDCVLSLLVIVCRDASLVAWSKVANELENRLDGDVETRMAAVRAAEIIWRWAISVMRFPLASLERKGQIKTTDAREAVPREAREAQESLEEVLRSAGQANESRAAAESLEKRTKMDTRGTADQMDRLNRIVRFLYFRQRLAACLLLPINNARRPLAKQVIATSMWISIDTFGMFGPCIQVVQHDSELMLLFVIVVTHFSTLHRDI